ncbi:MAG: hypothetical protein ACRD0U_20145 [Acidimicrobiales bacterium]
MQTTEPIAITSAALDPGAELRSRTGAIVTAAAMVAAPLLIVTAELLSPINDSSDTPTERVAAIFDNAGRYSLTVACLVAGLLLLVPAVLTLRNTVVPHRRAGTVGAVVSAAGFMLFAVASGALGVAPSAWASLSDAHQQALVPAFTAMDDGKGAMPLALSGPLLPVIGLIVLAVVLWRHSGYPRWAVLALPLGWTLFLFTPAHASRVLGALVLLAGLTPTITLLTRPPATR